MTHEFRRLIDDSVHEFGTNFCSSNSDFYWNRERKESYGCIVTNMMSKRYIFKDGRKLFISKKSLAELNLSELSIDDFVLCDLEYVMNCELFQERKTGSAIGVWFVGCSRV